MCLRYTHSVMLDAENFVHVYFYNKGWSKSSYYYGCGLIISTLFNKLHTNDEKIIQLCPCHDYLS